MRCYRECGDIQPGPLLCLTTLLLLAFHGAQIQEMGSPEEGEKKSLLGVQVQAGKSQKESVWGLVEMLSAPDFQRFFDTYFPNACYGYLL